MNDTDHAQELRNARGQLRALELYAENHPGAVPPLLGAARQHVTALAARLAATDPTNGSNMSNLPARMKVMRDHLSDLNAELEAIHRTAGDRPLTAAQQTRWDAIEAESEETATNLAAAEAEEVRQARIDVERRKWGSFPTAQPARDQHIDPETVARMSGADARDAALRSLETTAAAHLDDTQRAHVDQLLREESGPNFDAGALARHVALTNSPAYRSAFRQIMAPRMSNIVTLSEQEAAAVATVQRASMAEGTGSTGGFAVPAYLDPTIVLNAQGAANPLRRLAKNETITTNKWKGVSTAGITWAFVPEGEASTDASPTVGQPVVDVHTARAYVVYSIELQQDAVDLDGQLLALLAAGWDDTLAGALATGTGIGQPKGILTALDAVAASEVKILAPGALAPADVSAVWQALPDRARDASAWLMSESVRETIAAWGDAYGNRTVDLGGRLTKLRNRDVFSTEKFPAIETTTGTANQMVVGDFSGYLIAQRAGMSVEPIQTVVNGDGLPTGQRGLFAWARIGADVIDPGKLRLLQQ